MINLFLMKHILKYLASGHQLETCVLLEFRLFNVRFRRCCCKPPKDAAGHWDIVNKSWKYFPGKKMLQNVQNTIFWAIFCKNSCFNATKP